MELLRTWLSQVIEAGWMLFKSGESEHCVIDTAHIVLLISTLNNWFLVKFFNPAIPKIISSIGDKAEIRTGRTRHASGSMFHKHSNQQLHFLFYKSAAGSTVETYLEDELGNVSAAKAFQASGGIQKTTQIVNKIVTDVIGVGIVTSAFTLANLILWVLITKRLYWLIFELMLSKVYFNSVLVMLNSRAKLRDELMSSVAR
ncbi:hypothetical protein DFH08DRAFT_821624 [Mycena albidolilacea]|uniref:DUF6534 domain-containing protein n=1 Tax=Mycena albidolilacea TaxID=1033008 RepID=A0AAD7EDF6_9AGAR|nr:hypothetical protein DFH08DRAFT_821624 [Mycena albidolilacea]